MRTDGNVRPSQQGADQVKPDSASPRGDGERNLSSEVAEPKLSRKASNEGIWCPYRKPTQVGEERILRRARESSLRNSAKLPRNFGRRGASLAWRDLLPEREEAAVNWPKRLFTKNTGLC